MRPQKFVAGILVIAIGSWCCLTGSVAQGQSSYNWSPLFSTGSSFGESFNWSPSGGPPGELDTAVFNTGTNSTATFNYSPFNASLQHQSGNTIFRPSGTNATYSLTGASTISGGSLTINPDGIFKLDVRFSGLTLSGNSTLFVNAGEVSSVGAIHVGNGSAGSIQLNGSTAKLTSSFLGQNTLGGSTNGDGILRLFNGATGSMAGSLRIGGGPSTSGILELYSGSTFSFGNANIGDGNVAGQLGLIYVTGNGSTVTQTGSSTLNIGKASNAVVRSTVQADSGGTYNTGTGLTTVNATGEIFVTGGTFNANGDVNVDGGTISRSSGNFNLASGRTLTASNDAQINMGGTNTLSGGTTWNINSGAELSSTGAMHIGVDNGTTMVTVDGAGSTLSTSGITTSNWGANGHSANVTLRNGATATIQRINVGASSGSGTVNVESGASMNVATLNIATSGTASTGVVNVDDAAMAQSGVGTTLTIGQNSGGSATLNVLNNGLFETHTNLTTINKTGSVSIGTGSAFFARSDVNVNGGSINSSNGGDFVLAAGRTLNAGDGAVIDLGTSDYDSLSSGTTWNIRDGSQLRATNDLAIGAFTGSATLVVDGVGSTLNTGSSFSSWGWGGHTADISLTNGASGNVGSIALGSSTAPGTTGLLSIESGASMTAGQVTVANTFGNADPLSQIGSITVTGSNSLLTQTIGSGLVLGNGISGTATLNLLEGGTFIAGSAGTVVHNTGTINIDGGFANLGLLDRQGGTVNFHSGSLSYGGDLTVGSGGLLGNGNVTLESNRQLALTGTTTVNSFRTLKLDGGSLSTGELAIQPGGTFDFVKGALGITGAGGLQVGSSGALGSTLTLGNQQTLNVAHHTEVGSDGFVSIGNGGRLQSNTLANYGEILLAGANARVATSSATLTNHGLLSGDGRIEGSFINASTGLVSVDAGKKLTFDSTVENQFGGRMTGRGTLIAPSLENYGQMLYSGGFSDLYAPIVSFDESQIIVTGGSTATFFESLEVKGGAELRVSSSSNAVFFDHVQLRDGALLTGDGNVFFEGSLGIGNSPSRQEFSFNVTLGPTSNLLVEIAGTDAFLPEFDQFIFHKDLTLQLGAMTVDLIGLNEGDPAFMPSAGDSFQIFEVHGNWTGTFGLLDLPSLSSGLHWNTTQLYSHGTLSVFTAIPEPSSGLFLMVAFVALVGKRRVRVGV